MGKANWAALPKPFRLVPEVAREISVWLVDEVTVAAHAHKVGNASVGDGAREFIGMAHRPVGHIAAVRAAHYAHVFIIDAFVFLHHQSNCLHVCPIGSAPVISNGIAVFSTVSL